MALKRLPDGRFRRESYLESLLRQCDAGVTVYPKTGRHYGRSHEIHRLRLYRGSDLAVDLRFVGVRVRPLRGYGRLRFARAHVALPARKA